MFRIELVPTGTQCVSLNEPTLVERFLSLPGLARRRDHPAAAEAWSRRSRRITGKYEDMTVYEVDVPSEGASPSPGTSRWSRTACSSSTPGASGTLTSVRKSDVEQIGTSDGRPGLLGGAGPGGRSRSSATSPWKERPRSSRSALRREEASAGRPQQRELAQPERPGGDQRRSPGQLALSGNAGRLRRLLSRQRHHVERRADHAGGDRRRHARRSRRSVVAIFERRPPMKKILILIGALVPLAAQHSPRRRRSRPAGRLPDRPRAHGQDDLGRRAADQGQHISLPRLPVRHAPEPAQGRRRARHEGRARDGCDPAGRHARADRQPRHAGRQHPGRTDERAGGGPRSRAAPSSARGSTAT